MKDCYGRDISYLRISLTDRCNLQCIYCSREFRLLPKKEILTLEEIERTVKALSLLGIKKIRLTGGEPLLRQGVVDLSRRLSEIQGIKEVCLTTNGILLKEFAKGLFEAGVRHINISLDSLRRNKFFEITGRDVFEKVIHGIEMALEMGFSPVKINTVLIRGVNDDEILNFAGLTRQRAVEWRAIEFMPIGSRCGWKEGHVITSHEVKSRIQAAFGPLEEVVHRNKWHGPAQLYRIRGARGLIGLIGAISHPFCSTCNRIRLTPEGRLRLCLFSDHEVDIKPMVRARMRIEDLSRYLYKVIRDNKPLGPGIQHQAPKCIRAMRTIGG